MLHKHGSIRRDEPPISFDKQSMDNKLRHYREAGDKYNRRGDKRDDNKHTNKRHSRRSIKHHSTHNKHHNIHNNKRHSRHSIHSHASIQSESAAMDRLLAEKDEYINVKLKKIENNNSWSGETELIAAEVGEKAQGYVWMHNRNASYLTDWDTRYSNAEIILSILTGTSVFTTINNCQELSLITLVTGIVIYMTAVVRAIHQNRKYPERASAHRLSASKYSEIYHSVQKQLALYRRDRENAKDYINWITEKFDTLLLSSPGMDDAIREEYLTKFKNVKFMHPGDLKKIGIKKESPDGSNESLKHYRKPGECSSADFSSDYDYSDDDYTANVNALMPVYNGPTGSGGLSNSTDMRRRLNRSTTLRTPDIDKKLQYEIARYTLQ